VDQSFSSHALALATALPPVLLNGVPMVSLDNCNHDLGGELLCQVSERPVVKIRILGRSEMLDCECHTALFAIGNNITFKGGMVRRGLVCKFEALDERPELREFQQDALEVASNNRSAYVAAALTIGPFSTMLRSFRAGCTHGAYRR
jgi:putative DNA primase/helicase